MFPILAVKYFIDATEMWVWTDRLTTTDFNLLRWFYFLNGSIGRAGISTPLVHLRRGNRLRPVHVHLPPQWRCHSVLRVAHVLRPQRATGHGWTIPDRCRRGSGQESTSPVRGSSVNIDGIMVNHNNRKLGKRQHDLYKKQQQQWRTVGTDASSSSFLWLVLTHSDNWPLMLNN